MAMLRRPLCTAIGGRVRLAALRSIRTTLRVPGKRVRLEVRRGGTTRAAELALRTLI